MKVTHVCLCVCVCPQETRNKSGVTGWGGGCLPGWHSPTESQSVHFRESEMLRKEEGDTTIEAQRPCTQIICFGFFFPQLSFFWPFHQQTGDRKETKMSHVCWMKNGLGSWCYVIFFFFFTVNLPRCLCPLYHPLLRGLQGTLWELSNLIYTQQQRSQVANQS